MPYLVAIKEETAKDNREVGDVIWVYPDDHKFTEKELAEFSIKEITEEKAKEFFAALPKLKTAFKAPTTEWTLEPPTMVEVFEDSFGWCEVKDKSFYRPVQYKNGIFVNKLLEKEINKTVSIAKSEKS